METKNKRVQLLGANEFKVEECIIPELPADGVLIKVQFAGICHSDVHISRGINPKFIFPRVMGHEIAGVIHQIGEEAATAFPALKTGARVVVYPWGNCTKCTTCRADLPYCPNMVMPTGTGSPGTFVYGLWQDGGYQNYVVVHKPGLLVPVPDDLDLATASLVPCSGITAQSAILSLKDAVQQNIKINGKAIVAMFGAGGLALWAIQLAKVLLPPEVKVVAVDLLEDKLKDAKEQGADETFKWGANDTVPEVVGNFLKQVGGYVDGAIDFTGLAAVQEKIFALLNVGGTMTMIGLGKLTAAVPVNGMILKQITVKGNIVGAKSQVSQMFDLLQQGKIKPPSITEVTLDDVEETLKKLEDGTQRGRAVVKM